MATQYGKNAVLERLVSGSTATHTSGSATLFCSGSAAGATQSLYFFKGNGDVVDVGGGSTLGVDGDSGTGTVDLSSQEFTIAGGTGVDTTMSGQTLTIDVDLGEATEAAIDVSTDYGLFLDGGATGGTRKDSWADIATAMAGTVTTTGMAASSGVFSWDLDNWTASTSIADADLVGIDDGANGTLRKMTRGNFLGAATAAFSNGLTATTGDFSAACTFDGNVTLGDAATDVTTVTSQLTCSQGADFSKVTNHDAGLTSTTITGSGAATLASLHCDSVNLDGGNIDGTIIGAASAAAGTFAAVVATSLDNSDGNITNVGDLDCDSISPADAANGLEIQFAGVTATNKIELTDNLAEALTIEQDGNDYMKFVTTNSSEQIVFGKNSTFASTTIANLGTVSAATSITATDLVGTNIDGIIGADTARAGTFAAVVATSLDCSDGNITDVGVLEVDTVQSDADAAGLNINFDGNTGTNLVSLTDNLASALDITQAGNSYMKFETTNGEEHIMISKNVEMNGDLDLESDHDVTARAFITYSDVALKENIETVTNAMDMIQNLRGVSYDLKNGGKREFGFIAQEVNTVVPEVVHTSGDMMGIDYTRITSLLVEAVKTQQVEIEALKDRLDK